MTEDYLSRRSCWLSPLTRDPKIDAGQIVLDLSVIGVNHPPGAQCSNNDPPMNSSALVSLAEALRGDWAGPSQIVGLTGVRNTNFPHLFGLICEGDAAGCGPFDDCFVDITKASAVPFSEHPLPANWSSSKTEREFSTLIAVPPGHLQWSTVGAPSVEQLGQLDAGYERALYHIVLQNLCNPLLKFSLFLTHLSLDPSTQAEELRIAMSDILHDIGTDEYAPVLMGDFNGSNVNVRPELAAAFDEVNFPTNQACKDGGQNGASIPVNPTMKILLGKTTYGSPFGFTRGRFVVVRQATNAQTFDTSKSFSEGGLPVDGILHTLVSVGLKAQSNSAQCPGRETRCRATGACISLDTSENCGSCGNACRSPEVCANQTCRAPVNKCPIGTILCPCGLCGSNGRDCLTRCKNRP